MMYRQATSHNRDEGPHPDGAVLRWVVEVPGPAYIYVPLVEGDPFVPTTAFDSYEEEVGEWVEIGVTICCSVENPHMDSIPNPVYGVSHWMGATVEIAGDDVE